jgi:ABC-type sugar transport system ATPase subunit
MDSTIFEFRKVEKTFFGIKALKGVTLSLRPGSVLGLIGENGAGKSTLMNVMGGVHRPERGEMVFDGKPYAPRDPREATAAGVGFIHQELNLFTNLSVCENVFIDSFPRIGPFVDKRAIASRTRELLAELDLSASPNAVVETLSPGERQLVEIAKVLATNARIIIFDEPTTSLTAKETTRLFEIIRKLRARGAAIVYISHILSDVLALADDIAVLRDGQLVAEGPIAEFPVPRMITAMVGRDFSSVFPERKSRPGKEEALRIEGLSQTGIVRNIDLSLRKGEIMGVFGLMGSGRTEMARMVFGLDEYEEGAILVDSAPLPPRDPRAAIERGLAFVTENRREEGLLMSVSISDNIGLVSLKDFARKATGILDFKRLKAAAAAAADELKIKAGSYERQNAKSLSGGNQQKVVIAKWLLADPKVLIMDEPTRGIDVGAKYEVYSIMGDLAAKGSGVLFISSEIEELMGVCDRIVVMSRGEVQRIFERSEFSQERIMKAAFRQMDEEEQAV